MKKMLFIVILIVLLISCKQTKVVTKEKTNIKTDSISKVDSSVTNKTQVEKTYKISDALVINVADSFNVFQIKYDYINGDTSLIKSKTITTNNSTKISSIKNSVFKELKINSVSKTKIDLKKETNKKTIDKSKTTSEELPWYDKLINSIMIFITIFVLYLIVWYFVFREKN